MKKTFALILALVLALGCTAAFAEEAYVWQSQAPVGDFPLVSEPTSVSVYFGDNTSWIDYDQNHALMFFEQQTGVKLEINIGMLDVLLASGNYPEIIFNADRSFQQIADLADQGIVVPLESYFTPEITPYICSIVDEYYPNLFKMLTSPDGHIYGFSPVTASGESYAGPEFLINTAILDTLGKEYPTTTADFEDCLLAAKENGYIPYAFSAWDEKNNGVRLLLNAYIYALGQYSLYVGEDGTLQCAATTDAWKQGLTWVKSLWDQGLIYEGSFTQSLEDLQKLNNENKILAENTAHLECFYLDGRKSEHYRDVDLLEPLTGPDGACNTGYNTLAESVSGMNYLVTDTCANPELAVRILDFWLQPEMMLWNWVGAAGERFVTAPEGMKSIAGTDALIYDRRWDADFEDTTNSQYDDGLDHVRLVQNPNNFGIIWDQTQGVLDDLRADQHWTYASLRGTFAQRQKAFVNDSMPKISTSSLWCNADDANTVITVGTAVNNYINENIVAFITGSKSIENDWESYVSELEILGLANMLDILNPLYAEAIK